MSSAPGTATSLHASSVAARGADLSGQLVLLLAAGAGLSVAALYYCQPMLGVISADLGASDTTVGLVPTLTQLGYAIGILLLAPLGDRFDRRRVIMAKGVVLALALVAGAMAPGIVPLLVASLAIGMAATMAQDIVPAAATLAPELHRGKVVGTVMTGLLLGILLSRVVSGVVAEQFGWRAMFLASAVSIAALVVVVARGVPRFTPSTQLGYGALLKSLGVLWRQHGKLRRAALAQGLLAIGFSAFWSTLAVLLKGEPFHLGSGAAGAFGLAGAAGALAAPLAGRLADRRGPELVTRLGASLAALSFALMFLLPLLPLQAAIALLVLACIGFDMGVQVTLVAHQTIIYGIDPGARSRLNAVLFTGMFVGMSAGAAGGSMLLAHYGWPAVTLMATLSSLAGLTVRLWPQGPQRRRAG
jgi:predicted MFS family arabinose efflux permease